MGFITDKPDQWKTASKRIPKRLIRTPSDEAAIKAGCKFSRATVDWVIGTLEKYCRHDSGKWHGKPLVPSKWQIENIIEPVYGWIQPDGSRRTRWVYVQAPKKTPGKSTLAAGLATVALLEEPGALVYLIASTKEQAGSVVFSKLQHSIDLGPLQTVCRVRQMTKEIEYTPTNSMVKAVANKPMSGPSLSCMILDELHEWKTDEAYNSYKYAGRDRKQALFFAISNAGSDSDTLCHRFYLRAKAIEAGETIQTRWHTRIFEVPRHEAETEIEAVANGSNDIPVALQINPHVGKITSKKELVEDIREASKSPWEIANLMRFTYCIWVQDEDKEWLSPYIDRNRVDFTEEDMLGQPCHVGLDLAKSRDWTALSLVFPIGDHVYRVLPYFWLPEGRIRYLKRFIPVEKWVKDGLVRTFPGQITDYAQLSREIREIVSRFECIDLIYDKYGAEALTQSLAEELGLERTTFGQNHANYSDCTTEFERLMMAGDMQHNGNAAYCWQCQNAVRGENSRGYVMPVRRSKDDKYSIDSVQTTVMALASAMIGIVPSGKFYEEHDLEFI